MRGHSFFIHTVCPPSVHIIMIGTLSGRDLDANNGSNETFENAIPFHFIAFYLGVRACSFDTLDDVMESARV